MHWLIVEECAWRERVCFGTREAGCQLFYLRSLHLGGGPQLNLVILCEASSELSIAAVLQI